MSDHKAELKAQIMELVQERGPEKTICPSEAARAVNPDEWRPLMDEAREAACELRDEDKITIEQGGKPVDPSE